MEYGQHDFSRRFSTRVTIDRDTAAVVNDGDRSVDVNRDVYLIAETRESFVDRVVDDFIDEMMQASRTRRADVHGWTLPHGLEPLENLDLVGGILGNIGRGPVPIRLDRGVGSLR